MAAVDDRPGFRRRFRVEPEPGCVRTAVEDDYHCMAVTVHHAGGVAHQVNAEMIRAPWTTCPGAVDALQQAFAGVPLADFAWHGDKTTHCTHLYDLAVLGAAHAFDDRPVVYDILVSDPGDDGARHAEIRRDGEALLAWSEAGFHIRAPEDIAGTRLDKLGRWIDAQEPSLREPARLLRWGNMIAHGRTRPMEQQSDASRMPPTCFTFQPDRARRARRVGEIRDFTRIAAQPLEEPRYAP